MFKSKQDKTEYRNYDSINERQIRAMFAKIDNISNRLDQASSWAKEIEQKLDTVIALRSQPVQPVETMPQVTIVNAAPDEVTPDVEPDKFERNGKRKRIFYATDPLGFIERKIDNATSAHKTASCIFLHSLLTAVHGKNLRRRERITAAKLVKHLTELLRANRIVAIRVVKTSDIAFRLSSSEKPLPKRYSVLSTKEAVGVLGLFEMWNRNG